MNKMQEAVEYIEGRTLTVRQAADETGLSLQYLHKLVRRDKPDSLVTIHGRQYIKREWITNLLQLKAAKK